MEFEMALIKYWQEMFNIQDWKVNTEQIDLEKVTIEWAGETYFVGVARDFDTKQATIFHDIELTEESIIHELLHIVFPKPQVNESYQDYEKWITEAAENISENYSAYLDYQ